MGGSDVIWSEEEYKEISELLLREKGFVLEDYKSKFMSRRIGSRVFATASQSLSDYIRFLQEDTGELRNLYNALTVNVSSFFRNREVFSFIDENILPEVGREKIWSGKNYIDIWSAGCATGEEPYTMAILAERFARKKLHKIKVRIFATDIDKNTLHIAKTGEYKERVLAPIPPEIIKRCFSGRGDRYRVKDFIKGMVRFKRDNFLDFKQTGTLFDLILCRNIMIYFSKENHIRAYEHFSNQLHPGGYLVLGKSEILLSPGRKYFEVESIENRIYKKIG